MEVGRRSSVFPSETICAGNKFSCTCQPSPAMCLESGSHMSSVAGLDQVEADGAHAQLKQGLQVMLGERRIDYDYRTG